MMKNECDPSTGLGMTYPDRLILPLSFDPARLAADLAALAGAPWIDHFVKQNYRGDWSVIPLRGPAGATHPVLMIYSDPTCFAFEDAPFLAACPYFREVLAAFACPLQAVRLMRLGPGSVIEEHRDHDLSFEQGVVRVHVPVVTNGQVDFRINRERIVLEAGSAWYLRLSDPHSVANRGADARVHLVIDAVVDPWIEALFASAAAQADGS
jgi:quercetin dioxygenase-like cupin family protein